MRQTMPRVLRINRESRGVGAVVEARRSAVAARRARLADGPAPGHTGPQAPTGGAGAGGPVGRGAGGAGAGGARAAVCRDGTGRGWCVAFEIPAAGGAERRELPGSFVTLAAAMAAAYAAATAAGAAAAGAAGAG
jgi:hypothetical protein